MTETITTKQCKRCRLILPTTDFYKGHAKCKTCHTLVGKESWIDHTCELCGQPYKVKPSCVRNGTTHFCSLSCSTKANRLSRITSEMAKLLGPGRWVPDKESK